MNNRNKNKPGYKKTKIGWIPKGWDITICKHIADLTAGGTPSTNHDEYWNGKIPWMSSGELNLKRVYNVEGRISQLGLKNSSTKMIPQHSVLIGLAGQGKTRGTVAINEIELCTNQSVAAIIPNNSLVYYLYLYYYFNNIYFELRKLSAGDGGRGGLNLSLLASIKIPLPPLHEQKRIAAILSAWDKSIEKTENLIEAKESLKKGLMQKLLTGKVRFEQYFNNEKNKRWETQKGLGMPDDWEEVRLGSVFEERNEIEFIDLPLLSVTGSQGVIPFNDLDRKDLSNEDKSKYKRICPGDIGYNTMRMWQGRSALSSLEGIVSPAYTICVPSEKIDAVFASYLFKTDFMIHQFYKHSQGLTSDTWNLKYQNFSRIKIYLPPKDEQKDIAYTLSKLDNEISILKKKLESLKQQKKGLMQKLLTGAVRVKV